MSGMNGSIDRNTICSVQLKAEQWEITLQALGKLPYEISAPIIQQIVPQIMAYSAPRQEQDMENVYAKSN